MANQGPIQPAQTTPPATPGLTGISVQVVRETGKKHTYTKDLDGYVEISDNIIDVTSNNSYSLADNIQFPVDTVGYYAYEYVCVIESSKPINIFTSCPFAFGNWRFDQNTNATFNGFRSTILPQGGTLGAFSGDSIYIDVFTEDNYVIDYLRENNGIVTTYDRDNFVTPPTTMLNVADFDNYTNDKYDAQVTYAFSSYNMFNGDFLYEVQYGLGYKIHLSRFEEDAEVRVRLYKKLSTATFIECAEEVIP